MFDKRKVKKQMPPVPTLAQVLSADNAVAANGVGQSIVVKNGAGTVVGSIGFGSDGALMVSADASGAIVHLNADGSIDVTAGPGATATLEANGAGAGIIQAKADGTVQIGGAGPIELLPDNGIVNINGQAVVTLPLPTADPAVANAFWNDDGIVKVSAG